MKALIWSGTPKAYPPKEIDPENLAGETWHLVFVVGTKSIRAVAYFTSYSPFIHNIPVQISTITQIE